MKKYLAALALIFFASQPALATEVTTIQDSSAQCKRVSFEFGRKNRLVIALTINFHSGFSEFDLKFRDLGNFNATQIRRDDAVSVIGLSAISNGENLNDRLKTVSSHGSGNPGDNCIVILYENGSSSSKGRSLIITDLTEPVNLSDFGFSDLTSGIKIYNKGNF